MPLAIVFIITPDKVKINEHVRIIARAETKDVGLLVQVHKPQLNSLDNGKTIRT